MMRRNREKCIANGELGLYLNVVPGDKPAAAASAEHMQQLGTRHVRLKIACDQWRAEESRAWYAWLLRRVAKGVCVNIVLEPSDGPDGASEGPAAMEAVMRELLEQGGDTVEAVELPVQPWENRLGSQWPQACRRMSALLGAQATCFVLGSDQWHEAGFVARCRDSGVLGAADAVGVAMEIRDGSELPVYLDQVRRTLQSAAEPLPLWLTQVDVHHSAPQPYASAAAVRDALECGADRIYWQGSTLFGLGAAAGEAELAGRLLEAGREHLSRIVSLCRSPRHPAGREEHVLITGGAGFVGANLADRLLSQGERVVVFDNLARPGTERNVYWLKERHGDRVQFVLADVRDRAAVDSAVVGASHVFHFAGQVAVTSSLQDPLHDHDVNVRGTLCLLEALRARSRPPPLIFTSTNKVYGALDDVALQVTQSRYEPIYAEVRNNGIDESRPLQFCSPYGCSKGAADQYVLDYCKTFGIDTVCFRMSCIYGWRQFGNEDQGWVAHFVKQAVTGGPITIYGDGLQVRDVLFVDDLVEAFLSARAHMRDIRGSVFNIGGGPENVLSLVELLAMIEDLDGRAPVTYGEEWRPSDQRYYVSNIRRFREATGWRPRVSVDEGVRRLYRWMDEEFGGQTVHKQGKVAL